jgi:hypothetical protein
MQLLLMLQLRALLGAIVKLQGFDGPPVMLLLLWSEWQATLPCWCNMLLLLLLRLRPLVAVLLLIISTSTARDVLLATKLQSAMTAAAAAACDTLCGAVAVLPNVLSARSMQVLEATEGWRLYAPMECDRH